MSSEIDTVHRTLVPFNKKAVTTANGAANGTTIISLHVPGAGVQGLGEADNFWNDAIILVLTGDMKDQVRRVITWVRATGTLTVDHRFANPKVSLLSGNVIAGAIIIPVVDASVFSVGEAYVWDAANAETVTITLVDTVLNQLTIAAPGLVNPYTVAAGAAVSMSPRILAGTRFVIMTPTSAAVTSKQNVSFQIKSDKDNNFTTAIAVNAKEDENLTGLENNKVLITNVAILSDERLYYRVLFYKTDGFDDADLDVDSFIAAVDLDLTVNGFQIGGAGKWLWDEKLGRGNGVEYNDEDGTRELHVSLQNLGPGAKTAGAGGEVVIKVSYLPLV